MSQNETIDDILLKIKEDIAEADNLIANLDEHDRVWFEERKNIVNSTTKKLEILDVKSIEDKKIQEELLGLLKYIDTYIENNSDLWYWSNKERCLHVTLVKYFLMDNLLGDRIN